MADKIRNFTTTDEKTEFENELGHICYFLTQNYMFDNVYVKEMNQRKCSLDMEKKVKDGVADYCNL